MSEQPRIRVLHIFGRMERGGAEMRTIDLLRNIDLARYDIHFCALSGRPGVLDAEIATLGGTVHLCGLSPTFPWRFRALLRRERIDVVHSHVHMASGYILRLAAQAGIGMRIAHFRSSSDGRTSTLRRKLQRGAMRWMVNRYATHILSVSEAAMSDAWSPDWRDDQRCRVVYSGIDTAGYKAIPDGIAVREEFGIPDESPFYIHVGRMDPPKNHLRLLAIFDAVLRRQPGARLLLVGRGGTAVESAVRARVAELGLGERVVFAGQRSDVPRLLRAADVLVFPSLWEGLPGVVLEAAAAGTPALVTDLRVMREITGSHPSLRQLPLQASDDEWAHAAEQLSHEGASLDARATMAARFEAGPFTISHHVRAVSSIWSAA